MLVDIETKQRRNHVEACAKGRRKKTDRRKKIEKLTALLDRRNIQDRRDTKDRRLSKNKTFLFPVTQQGITIKELSFEKEKLINLMSLIIKTGASLSYIDLVRFMQNIYYALRSQATKESVLCEWYEEMQKHSKMNLDKDALIFKLDIILRQEMEEIIAVLDKYLSLDIDLDDNRALFIRDMRWIQETLETYNTKRLKYIYPHYQKVLSLS